MSIQLRYNRRSTSTTQVGKLQIGSAFPIRIQTMANTSTNDIEGSVSQAIRCEKAGAELFRLTTQGMKEVESIGQISQQLKNTGCHIPLVADIHFRSDVADEAAQTVEKVRINPGNYAKDPEEIRSRFCHLIDLCKKHKTALRIGVNHGSLSARMMEKYGDTPQGMVESCMEFLRIAVEQQFSDIVLSIKASNTRVMVDTVRLLVKTMEQEQMHFPLHLGVTEAGEGEDGRIKSAVGIGALLADGIGDTVRVSLSEEPEAELPVAQAIVDYFVSPDSPRYHGVEVTKEGNKLLYTYPIVSPEKAALMSLHAAAECGRLLWDEGCNELEIIDLNNPSQSTNQLAKDILQAAGICRYKTEFVSCPGCGRTMFDLQTTVARIKEAFRQQERIHLSHYPKIAVMGCIVNGPGEMADADYGYVGAGRDRVSLYRRKECVLKNIPQEEAVEQLLHLIEQDTQH